MRREHKQWLVLLALFVGANAGVFYASLWSERAHLKGEGKTPRKLVVALPLRIGKWIGEDIPQEDNVYEILDTNNVVTRNYVTGEEGEILVGLSIVYYEDTILEFHLPEHCYTGAGRKVESRSVEKMVIGGREIEVKKLIIRDTKSDYKQIVYFWYISGDLHTANVSLVRLRGLKDRIMRKIPRGSYVQITAGSLTGNPEEIEQQLHDFAEDIFPHLSSVFRKSPLPEEGIQTDEEKPGSAKEETRVDE